MMITEILNYSIIRKLGEGAMGQVFLAKNKSIHQFVAVKMLNPRYSGNPVLRERFRREAMMLSSLNHPNIVKFLNYVENENGIFLIMEYVDGMTLEDYLNTKTGLLVESNAFPLMLQILDAFEYAHDHNVIHRDIKPGNIFVTREGQIKILDFGIAQILSESNEGEQASYGGTIEYMSPEQVHGKPLEIRSDIYSLGVVFYQMLTGRHPYDTSRLSDLDIKKAIVSEPLPRMKEAYPYVSPQIQSVVDRATEKEPGQRFESCRELKTKILSIRNANANGGSGGPGAPVGPESGGIPVNPDPIKKKNNLWVPIVAGVVVLAGLCVGAYFLFFKDGQKLYLEYAEKYGIPEGIGSIPSESDTICRYRFSFKDGRPERITLVDAAGQKAEMTDSIFSHYRPVETEYVYTAKGRLDHKKVYDSHSNLLFTVKYNDDASEATVERPGDGSTTAYLLVNDKSTGQLEAIHYVDNEGMKIPYQGVYGEEYKYDKQGRLERITYLDESYHPTENQSGVAIVSFEYSLNPARTRSVTYDKGGAPVVPKPVEMAASADGQKKSKKAARKEYNDSVRAAKRNAKGGGDGNNSPKSQSPSHHQELKEKLYEHNRNSH